MRSVTTATTRFAVATRVPDRVVTAGEYSRNALDSARMTQGLLLADRVVFTCQSCGDCCRGDWLIGVDDAAHAALKDVDWAAHDPALGAGEKFTPLAVPLVSGEHMTFARASSGACVFLTAENRCGIHNHLGYGAKPQVCREFPYHFVETPDGITVGLSFACTAVLHHRGAPLA